MLHESTVDPPLVLVAEDSPDVRELFVAALGSAGMRTVHVEDGREAVEAARLLCPDAMVLDLRMPRLGGHDAIARMRRDPLLRDMPIVVVSGAEREELERAVAMGATFACRKPCPLDTIVELVQRALFSEGSRSS